MTNMVMIMMPPCYDLYNRRRSWLVRTQIYMTRWNAPKLYWQHAVICTMCIVQWYAVCITWRTLRKTHTVYLCIVLLCTLHDRIDCAKLYQQYFQFTDMHCTIVCRVQFRVQCTVLCSVQCAMYERLLVGRNVTDYQGVIPGISVFSHNHCPHHRHRYHHSHHHRHHHHRFFSVFHHHFQQGFIHRLKLGPC